MEGGYVGYYSLVCLVKLVYFFPLSRFPSWKIVFSSPEDVQPFPSFRLWKWFFGVIVHFIKSLTDWDGVEIYDLGFLE